MLRQDCGCPRTENVKISGSGGEIVICRTHRTLRDAKSYDGRVSKSFIFKCIYIIREIAQRQRQKILPSPIADTIQGFAKRYALNALKFRDFVMRFGSPMSLNGKIVYRREPVLVLEDDEPSYRYREYIFIDPDPHDGIWWPYPIRSIEAPYIRWDSMLVAGETAQFELELNHAFDQPEWVRINITDGSAKLTDSIHVDPAQLASTYRFRLDLPNRLGKHQLRVEIRDHSNNLLHTGIFELDIAAFRCPGCKAIIKPDGNATMWNCGCGYNFRLERDGIKPMLSAVISEDWDGNLSLELKWMQSYSKYAKLVLMRNGIGIQEYDIQLNPFEDLKFTLTRPLPLSNGDLVWMEIKSYGGEHLGSSNKLKYCGKPARVRVGEGVAITAAIATPFLILLGSFLASGDKDC